MTSMEVVHPGQEKTHLHTKKGLGFRDVLDLCIQEF